MGNIFFVLPKKKIYICLKVSIVAIPNFPALHKLFRFLFQTVTFSQNTNYESVDDYFQLQ